jgi:hypothetical protein
MRLGAGIVICACILAASAAMRPALPQSGDLVPFDAGYLEADAFVDDSLQAVRQDAATESDQKAPPIFGMETEPVAGEVAPKWRAVEAVLNEEGTRHFVPSNRAGQGPGDGRSSPVRFVRPA